MYAATLLHELSLAAATRTPDAVALRHDTRALCYAELASEIERFAAALAALGVGRGERVAIQLDKRFETVIASFGTAAHGAVFVPVNPLLKPAQVAHILRDCGVCVLVTGAAWLAALEPALGDCADLRHVVLCDGPAPAAARPGTAVHRWREILDTAPGPAHRVIDIDTAAILYTSGSTGLPKGVVLSHRNLVAGARSVASYLQNHAGDVLLAALPLSFDAGFSQLTTAFEVGASVVLLDYLLPRDVVKACETHGITGITGVPPLWIQLATLAWPEAAARELRYIANTGGRLPLETLTRLRAALPRARPHLMYGLTEAFRATTLDPEEVDRRPDSIGKAIPGCEVLVLRPDGTRCDADEPGELVQRGAHVAQGYWNDPARTAERFRPLARGEPGPVLPEIAVFSGDTVRCDADGFHYFIGRRGEMIKSSGYRISPTEVEEAVYSTRLVGECAAFGVPHAALGEVVVVVATGRDGEPLDVVQLMRSCRQFLPSYMLPSRIVASEGALPRNPNGKIDRKAIGDAHRLCAAGVP